MTLSHLKDIGFIAGCLLVTFGGVLIMKHREITAFDLWPETVKWGLVVLICCGFVAVAAYALGMSKREDHQS